MKKILNLPEGETFDPYGIEEEIFNLLKQNNLINENRKEDITQTVIEKQFQTPELEERYAHR